MYSELMEKARERRLSSDHHDNGNLVGYCFDNMVVVNQLLKENGLNPTPVCGVAEYYAKPVIEEKGLDNIEYVDDLDALVHFWTEVDGMILDLARETKKNRGDIYISSKLPDTYHRLEDSYEYAQEIVEEQAYRRCNYCGGRNRYCGCEEKSNKIFNE